MAKKKRSLSARRAAQRFRSAPLGEAKQLITAGFELETQRSAGMTWNSYQDTVPRALDPEARRLQRARLTRRWAKNPYDWVNFLRPRPEWAATNWYSYLSGRNALTLTKAVRAGVVTRAQAQQVRVSMRARAIDVYPDSAFVRTPEPTAYMQREHNLPTTIETGSDGTVRGFEFRTRGGLTLAQFTEASEKLFGMPHTIDAGCSFHIHVSVCGIQHSYGDKLQAAMVEYLATHVDEVPATVRRRWEGVRDNQYIGGLIGGQGSKYNFVNKHGRFNTWEFRCFGNVQSHADAMKCLDLAVAAMQYGYRVLAGEERSLYPWLNRDVWDKLIYEAIETGTPLPRVLEDTQNFPFQLTA